MRETCVYWIHTTEQVDIFSQGYVGISVNFDKRIREHLHKMRSGSTYTLYNAMRKHLSDLVFEKVLIGSHEYCLDVENKLRPTPGIGWNICSGGGYTRLGMPLSEDAKAKISVKNTGRVMSEETRKKMSIASARTYPKEFADACRERAIAQGGFSAESIAKAAEVNRNKPPWDNPNSFIGAWLIADKVCEVVTNNPEIGARNIAKMFGFCFSNYTVILRNIKSGWNPLNDPDWVAFKERN